MTGFGSFQASVQGMRQQSHALAAIGTNIVNATTTGYKRTETRFETVLGGLTAVGSAEPSGVDFGGVGALDVARVRDEGEIAATGGALDLAIDGAGFFVVSDARDGLGATRLTRDGGFAVGVGDTLSRVGADGIVTGIDEGYLVDRSGNYVLGWAIADDGSVPASGTPQALRIDTEAFSDRGRGTETARLDLNLPAGAAVGTAETLHLEVFDAAARSRDLEIAFVRRAEANTWSVQMAGGAGDGVSLDPPLAGGGPGAGAAIVFDPRGALLGPARYRVDVAHADGGTSAFTLDLGRLSQIGDDFLFRAADQDGRGPGRLGAVTVDAEGRILGHFDNTSVRPVYQLAIADVANPDGLERLSGNLFAATDLSGEVRLARAGEAGLGNIRTGALERSNVALEDEFSRMILTQNAYNAAATAFRTVDDMLATARDLRA